MKINIILTPCNFIRDISDSLRPPVNIALKYGEAAERTTLWAGKSSCLTSSITSLDMQKVMSSSLALRSSRSLPIADKSYEERKEYLSETIEQKALYNYRFNERRTLFVVIELTVEKTVEKAHYAYTF
uniref:Uncharacterized protein n=1 Tax=Glossina palpalis gambiensis TaxID=67801 RepID=A0A1B0AVC3_9MUSC